MFKPFIAADLSIGEDLSFVLPEHCQVELYAVSLDDVLVYARRADDTRLMLLIKNPKGVDRFKLEGFNLLQLKSKKPITARVEIADRPEHEPGVSAEAHVAIPLPSSPLQRLRAAMRDAVLNERYTLLDGDSPYEIDEDDHLFEEDMMAQPEGSETTGIERPEGGQNAQPEGEDETPP